MKKLSLAFLCTTMVAACSSTPDPSGSAAVPVTQPSAASTQAPSAPQPGTAAASQTTGQSGMATASVPTKNSVYFEYDSSAVKEQYRPLVTDHARYLSGQGAMRVTVEGNTDERGSREYNLALGQRRAEAVKDQLQLLGVPAARIEAISYGEEKPRSDAAEESAYAENRRADIVHARR